MIPVAPWSKSFDGAPVSGRPWLACFDEQVIYVFTAHGPAIADYALEVGCFGGEAWQDGRMTRFRLCFGDIYHHTRGGTVPGKERLLALAIRRDRFDVLLRQLVHWREFPVGVYETKAQWRLATRYAQAVIDWRPEPSPDGAAVGRECVRIGVRDHLQRSMNCDWIVGVQSLDTLVLEWGNDDDPSSPMMRPYPLPEASLTNLRWTPEVSDVS